MKSYYELREAWRMAEPKTEELALDIVNGIHEIEKAAIADPFGFPLSEVRHARELFVQVNTWRNKK